MDLTRVQQKTRNSIQLKRKLYVRHQVVVIVPRRTIQIHQSVCKSISLWLAIRTLLHHRSNSAKQHSAFRFFLVSCVVVTRSSFRTPYFSSYNSCFTHRSSKRCFACVSFSSSAFNSQRFLSRPGSSDKRRTQFSKAAEEAVS